MTFSRDLFFKPLNSIPIGMIVLFRTSVPIVVGIGDVVYRMFVIELDNETVPDEFTISMINVWN